MTGTQNISILHVYDSDENKTKEFFAEENLSQFCSTEEGKSDIVVAKKNHKEESLSECTHKIINVNEEKDDIDKQSMRKLRL